MPRDYSEYEADFKLLDKQLNKKKFNVIRILHDELSITLDSLATKAKMTKKQISDLIEKLDVFDVACSFGGGRFFMLNTKGYLYLLYREGKN